MHFRSVSPAFGTSLAPQTSCPDRSPPCSARSLPPHIHSEPRSHFPLAPPDSPGFSPITKTRSRAERFIPSRAPSQPDRRAPLLACPAVPTTCDASTRTSCPDIAYVRPRRSLATPSHATDMYTCTDTWRDVDDLRGQPSVSSARRFPTLHFVPDSPSLPETHEMPQAAGACPRRLRRIQVSSDRQPSRPGLSRRNLHQARVDEVRDRSDADRNSVGQQVHPRLPLGGNLRQLPRILDRRPFAQNHQGVAVVVLELA